MMSFDTTSSIEKRIQYSVIIPVYNAEKTLERCLNSLLREKYSNAEIILINDGSTDCSGDICQFYSGKYAFIKYLKQKNGGVSTARNAGLKAAEGEFVIFVDSDDYVVPDFFNILDSAQLKYNADFLMFSRCYDDGKTQKERILAPVSNNSRTAAMPAIIDAICKKTINPPWGKVYRRSIIEKNNIRFPVGASVAEDRAFNICYSMFINSFSVFSEVVYVVNTENEQSLSRRRHADLEAQFAITKHLFEDTLLVAPIPDHEKEQYRRAVNFGDCRGIYHDAKLMIADHMGWLERQRKLGKLCDEINRKHMKYPHTRYCTLITLPVRFRLTWVIDAIAWKLTH